MHFAAHSSNVEQLADAVLLLGYYYCFELIIMLPVSFKRAPVWVSRWMNRLAKPSHSLEGPMALPHTKYFEVLLHDLPPHLEHTTAGTLYDMYVCMYKQYGYIDYILLLRQMVHFHAHTYDMIWYIHASLWEILRSPYWYVPAFVSAIIIIIVVVFSSTRSNHTAAAGIR